MTYTDNAMHVPNAWTGIQHSQLNPRSWVLAQQVNEPLEQELIQRGWLDPQRKSQRTMLRVIGIITMVAATALFIVSLVGINMVSGNINLILLIAAFAGMGAGVFLLSIALLIYGAIFSIRTPLGEEQVVHWKGFAEYLKQASKGEEPAISPDYFERYLAHAAVFGLGTKWAEYFQTLGGMPLPIWFHATAGSNADFGAIVAVMSASVSAGVSAGVGGGSWGLWRRVKRHRIKSLQWLNEESFGIL